jgi:[acyl-carrier-protein] S-malonyltransferase
MKVALLFPGYGSQFVGMAKELYDESRVIQEYFEEASNCLNINFVKLCFASSDAELSKMANAYTAIFLTSSSIAALLKEEGIIPHVIAGYNLGEYAAICAAQGITHPDGLYLLNKFATFYQEATASLDAKAIQIKGIDAAQLTALCKHVSQDPLNAQIIIYNADDDHVVSGHGAAIDTLRELIHQHQCKVTELPFEVGLHMQAMEQIVAQLNMHLEKVDFKDLTIPLINGVDANILVAGDQVKAHVLDQIYRPVLWRAVMEQLHDADLILEAGPGSVLSTMAKTKYPDKMIMSINKRTDIDEVKKILGLTVPQTIQPTEL